MTTKAPLALMEMKVSATKMGNVVISYSGEGGPECGWGVPPDRRRARKTQKTMEWNDFLCRDHVPFTPLLQ